MFETANGTHGENTSRHKDNHGVSVKDLNNTGSHAKNIQESNSRNWPIELCEIKGLLPNKENNSAETTKRARKDLRQLDGNISSPRLSKELQKSNSKDPENSVHEWTKELSRLFSIEEMNMATECLKRYSTSEAIREIQMETTSRSHLILVRIIIIKETKTHKGWWGCEEAINPDSLQMGM